MSKAKRKLFGTDGIRGKANIYPMTPEVAMALGRSVTHHFQNNYREKPFIIIGKDTRLSCYTLEQAFAAGVCAQGGLAILTGPLPTPGVAFCTTSMRADAGVMISASHNPYQDNGIKIFDSEGYKLPDEVELKLEDMILNPESFPRKTGEQLGRARRLDEVFGRYIVHVKSTLDRKYSLEGMRIVIDCAHGAGYRVGPMVFEEMGAEVISLGVKPNGRNINDQSGALFPQNCAEAVKEYRADIGICLDGDADRLIVVDGNGDVVDGDQLIGILALFLKEKGEPEYKNIIGTKMCNMGLENFLVQNKMKLTRTDVGDRYIMEEMKRSGAMFGGEPSGHLIFKRYATTGDGILAALKVIECMKFFNKDLAELRKQVKLYPQYLKNVKVTKKIPLEQAPEFSKVIADANKKIEGKGRTLVRYSGTENLIRVMVEADDEVLAMKLTDELESAAKEYLK